MVDISKKNTKKADKLKIVTIGGGTGSFTLLTEIKKLVDAPGSDNGGGIEITAVVAMSDSGGSTGRLRVDMGVLPAGDVRQALVALSRSPEELRKLFTYRYQAGTMAGHTFGNLFLSTLEKINGSLESAITQAGKLLRVRGRIYPVTLHKHDLVVKMSDGSSLIGEGVVDVSPVNDYSRIYLTEGPRLNPNVARAIQQADIVIIAPGNFYCSIVPNFLVAGLTEALHESKAKTVFVANLLTKEGHTDGYDIVTFLDELEALSGGFVPGTVLYNTAQSVTPELEQMYKSEGGELVKLGDVDGLKKKHGTDFIGDNLIAKVARETLASGPLATNAEGAVDTVKRSLLRHDAHKVIELLAEKGFLP